MRGWWCTYSVLSLGTVGQPYLRERTNKDRGKLLGIEPPILAKIYSI